MSNLFADQLDTILQYADAIGKIEGLLRWYESGRSAEVTLGDIRMAIDELNAQRAKALEDAQ